MRINFNVIIILRFNAMTSKCSYRDILDKTTALRIIENNGIIKTTTKIKHIKLGKGCVEYERNAILSL